MRADIYMQPAPDHTSRWWGWQVPGKFAWVVQEIPNLIVLLW
jgi:hypothetical protein